MGLVLDTSVLIQLEREGTELLGRLGDLGEEPAVLPAIVYAELQVGVRLADSEARAEGRKARIEALTARLPVVEFDKAVAERWADLFAELSRAGKMIPGNDLAVAATAMQLGFSVLLASTGERHFETVPGLEVKRLPRVSRESDG